MVSTGASCRSRPAVSAAVMAFWSPLPQAISRIVALADKELVLSHNESPRWYLLLVRASPEILQPHARVTKPPALHAALPQHLSLRAAVRRHLEHPHHAWTAFPGAGHRRTDPQRPAARGRLERDADGDRGHSGRCGAVRHARMPQQRQPAGRNRHAGRPVRPSAPPGRRVLRSASYRRHHGSCHQRPHVAPHGGWSGADVPGGHHHACHACHTRHGPHQCPAHAAGPASHGRASAGHDLPRPHDPQPFSRHPDVLRGHHVTCARAHLRRAGGSRVPSGASRDADVREAQ